MRFSKHFCLKKLMDIAQGLLENLARANVNAYHRSKSLLKALA
jgi:hypothetical protein